MDLSNEIPKGCAGVFLTVANTACCLVPVP
jgi:hypothetical protein